MKNSIQVKIDSLEEEIQDNNQRLDEIHSLLKAFKNNVVGGGQISVDKKQYHLELEKEHREVEKQLFKLNKKLKSLSASNNQETHQEDPRERVIS